MKVGDYVRTKDGFIAKLIEIRPYLEDGETIETKVYDFDKNIDEYNNGVDWEYAEEIIIKSSPNIIDLIEVGDFITYKKGNIYIDIPYRVYGTYNEILEETELRIDDEYLKDIEILSIVTHEQFSQMEYKVGE